MNLSHNALIFGLGYLRGTGCTLSFGGDGAKMAITPEGRAALDELIAAGYAATTEPTDQIPNREHYRGTNKTPHIGQLAQEAGINPFTVGAGFIAFRGKVGP